MFCWNETGELVMGEQRDKRRSMNNLPSFLVGVYLLNVAIDFYLPLPLLRAITLEISSK